MWSPYSMHLQTVARRVDCVLSLSFIAVIDAFGIFRGAASSTVSDGLPVAYSPAGD
jgi:hypothetical protein